MDNTVVIDDIKTLCKSDRSTWVGFSDHKMVDDDPVILEDEPMSEEQNEDHKEADILHNQDNVCMSEGETHPEIDNPVEDKESKSSDPMNISQEEPPAKASSPAHESPINETGNPPEQPNSPIDPNNLAASSATTTTLELTQ